MAGRSAGASVVPVLNAYGSFCLVRLVRLVRMSRTLQPVPRAILLQCKSDSVQALFKQVQSTDQADIHTVYPQAAGATIMPVTGPLADANTVILNE